MSRPKNSFKPFLNPKSSSLGAQKVKNDPENSVKIKCQNWKKQRKWKLFNYTSRPQTVVQPYSDPKNIPLGPQQVKNDPKIK